MDIDIYYIFTLAAVGFLQINAWLNKFAVGRYLKTAMQCFRKSKGYKDRGILWIINWLYMAIVRPIDSYEKILKMAKAKQGKFKN